jgi:DNA-binding transcriptional regulator/RsmH inhibitor MraZ
MGTIDYFERKLDDKRRLTVPPELRDIFATGAVVTRGFGKYLHLYPKNIWEQLVEPKLNGDILDETIADLNVRFRMGKSEMRLDGKQGRLMLEQHQVEYAGITRDIVAINVGQYWRIVAKESADAAL